MVTVEFEGPAASGKTKLLNLIKKLLENAGIEARQTSDHSLEVDVPKIIGVE